MSLRSSFDGDGPGGRPVGRLAGGGPRHRSIADTTLLAVGTLACPSCDAPVSPGGAVLTPAAPLRCPYCAHDAHARDFLSLQAPSRPARVSVRVVRRARPVRPAGYAA